MHNNIVITGANSPYFESLLTLISSIHKDSLHLVDAIFVCDFGLDASEISRLKNLKKVFLVDANKNSDFYKNISSIKTKCHFLKMESLYDSIQVSKNVLWLDAGVCALKSLKPIFDLIDSEDIFLVGDTHVNKNFTHEDCIKIMHATEDELNGKQLSSGIFGFKSEGKYKQMIIEGWKYAQIPGCIDGFSNNHRHDQSILSILSVRYNCPTNDIDTYGYWTDLNRNIEKATEIGSVIFVHRRGYDNKNHLIYEN